MMMIVKVILVYVIFKDVFLLAETFVDIDEQDSEEVCNYRNAE